MVNASDTQSDNPDCRIAAAARLTGQPTVLLSGVSKLVAISCRQLGDHCRILQILKRVGGKLAGVWTMLPLAQTTNMRWFPAVYTGVLGIMVSLLKAPNKWIDLAMTLYFEPVVKL